MKVIDVIAFSRQATLRGFLALMLCQHWLPISVWAQTFPGAGPYPAAVSAATPNAAGNESLWHTRRFVVGSPFAHVGPHGELTLQPNVRVVTGDQASGSADASSRHWRHGGRLFSASLMQNQANVPILGGEEPAAVMFDQLADPEPGGAAGSWDLPQPMAAEPVFGELVQQVYDCCPPHRRPPFGGPLAVVLGSLFRTVRAPLESGIGRERLVQAPFEIATTQPMNNYLFRFDFAYDHEFPDRAEYLWAAPGRGPPLAEASADYQDLRFIMEVGSKRFSTTTNLPIRVVDPVLNANHAGLGDMSITTKTVLLDGNEWQITQLFRTHINTGAASSGLGKGHVSLEPGMLFRKQLNEDNYLHGEITYWFALGGDPLYSGQVLRDALGISHLAYDSDAIAIITTLELIHWTVLNGQRSVPVVGSTVDVDGEGIFNLNPGARLVWDTGGDLELVEFGVSGGFALTAHHWYRGRLRLDVRFSY